MIDDDDRDELAAHLVDDGTLAGEGRLWWLACWLTRPYLEWRWRRDRSVVCTADWCWRMCSDEYLSHCAKHGAMYE